MELQQKYVDKPTKVNDIGRDKRLNVTPAPVLKSPGTTIPTLSSNVEPEDIKTNVAKLSAIVKKGTTVIQHINLLNVLCWNADGNTLIIDTLDSGTPILLNFLSSDRADVADTRFTAIMNGEMIL